MKHRILSGTEIAEIIMDRQTRVVRSMKAKPLLAIVRTNNEKVIDTYLKLKQTYADKIGVLVEVFETSEKAAAKVIAELNGREDVCGIIVQLPLADSAHTDTLLNLVDPSKDIDGLANDSQFDPATPTAILWLLAAYNIDLIGKKVLVIGQGKLVGLPLTAMLEASGVVVQAADETTSSVADLVSSSQVIISATGSPHTVTSSMVSPDTIIIDAGTASEKGVLVGDVDADIRDRDDVSITPIRGGVGPLTIAALFENLILSATRSQK